MIVKSWWWFLELLFSILVFLKRMWWCMFVIRELWVRVIMFLFVDVMEYGVKLIFIVDVNNILEFFFFIESFRNYWYNFLLFNFMYFGLWLIIFFYYLFNSWMWIVFKSIVSYSFFWKLDGGFVFDIFLWNEYCNGGNV